MLSKQLAACTLLCVCTSLLRSQPDLSKDKNCMDSDGDAKSPTPQSRWDAFVLPQGENNGVDDPEILTSEGEIELSTFRTKCVGVFVKHGEQIQNPDTPGVIYHGSYAAPRFVFLHGLSVAQERYLGTARMKQRDPEAPIVWGVENQPKPTRYEVKCATTNELLKSVNGNFGVDGLHATHEPLVAVGWAAKNANDAFSLFFTRNPPTDSWDELVKDNEAAIDLYFDWRVQQRKCYMGTLAKHMYSKDNLGDGYVYAICCKQCGVLTEFLSGANVQFKDEKEVWVPGGAPRSEIMGAWRVKRDNSYLPEWNKKKIISAYVKNPKYKGGCDHPDDSSWENPRMEGMTNVPDNLK